MIKRYFKCVALCIVLIGVSAARADSYGDFFRALERDDPAAVSALLARGFDVNTPNPEGQPALTLALQRGAEQVAKVLMAHPQLRVDALNAAGETALMMAALHGRIGPLRDLALRGGRLDSPTGWTALHYAASGAEPAAVALLLDRGAPLEAVSPTGMTPLLMAVRWGGDSVVDALLARGADPRRQHPSGANAADFARAAGRDRLAERLARPPR
jgi:uncharacterized protein